MPWTLLAATLLGLGPLLPAGTGGGAVGSDAAGVGNAAASGSRADSLAPLIRAARAVREAGPRLDEVWPDFWPAGHPVLLYREGVALLVDDGRERAPAGWRRVPDVGLPRVLNGRAFRHSGPLDGLTGNFDMDYRVDGRTTAAAIPWSGDVLETLEVLYHEQFHELQQRGFAPTRGAGGLGLQVEAFVPPAAVADPSFRARAEVERRILRDAMAAETAGQRKALLRSYLAVRSRRMGSAPGEVRRAEINIERKEGSAKYVGLAAAVLAADAPRSAVREELDDYLAMALDSASLGESAYAGFRARLYGTGGVLAWLLEELAPGWREELAAGAPFPELVGEAVAFDSGRASELAREALARYGYPELVAGERARAVTHDARDPVEALLASARVKLVVELVLREPAMLNWLEFHTGRSVPRQLEEGLLLSPRAETFELSLGGVRLSAQEISVVLDIRSAPDTVRIVAGLETLPRTESGAPPAGEARWPEGLTLSSDALRLRSGSPTGTWSAPDSLLVRIEP